MSTRGFENLTAGEVAQRNQRIVSRAVVSGTAALTDTRLMTKPSKYRNVRCEVDSEKFDSRAEAGLSPDSR